MNGVLAIVVSDIQTFYAVNFDKLVKRINSRCGNYHDAEDIVQTAFERALKYVESCDTDLERWFSVILSNVLKKHQAVIRLGPVTKPLEEHLEDIEPIIPDDIRPIIKREVRLMVDDEPEPNKTVLRLHLDFSYTNGEIQKLVEGLTYRSINGIINNFRVKVVKRYK